MIDWSLTSDTQFCSVGPNHIFFWNLADAIGSTVKPKAGVFGREEQSNQLCAAHDENGVLTGGMNGKISRWVNGSIKKSE